MCSVMVWLTALLCCTLNALCPLLLSLTLLKDSHYESPVQKHMILSYLSHSIIALEHKNAVTVSLVGDF